jgi:2-oxoglutarate dehydrogenase E2 component (dihydrolipoamide succinyltransferase)
MASEVLMPQMGESIAEGTIVRWIKKVGDAVDRDEPLFEISTDKVDAEIPSPASGVLLEIAVKEGETVPVNSVVAKIGAAGEKPAASEQATAAPEPSAAATTPTQPAQAPPQAAAAPAQTAAAPTQAGPAPAEPIAEPGPMSKEELRRQKSSPLVRRIAKEHNINISSLSGSGINGRVTKKDILGFIESGAPAPAAAPQPPPAPPAQAGPAAYVPAFKPGERIEIVPMSVMRKKIAEHMVLSARTSPHVYSVYEVDFHRIAKLRAEKKGEYERLGANLTFTAFIAKAAVDALRQFPIVNASIDGENIVYKKDINLGIAVALDWGLIVPVIRNADEKNMLGLARGVNDLSTRARAKQLKPEEVQSGTFTITNPGIFGAVYGLPLINQPQAAILGVGSIDKRAVVVDDAIAIRPTCHITLGYDHRIIDGADAGRFLSYLKERLEHFDAAWV